MADKRKPERIQPGSPPIAGPPAGNPRQPHRGGPRGGGVRGMIPSEKARDFSGSMKKLIKYLGHHKTVIIIVWILAIISTVFGIIGPRILGGATDEIINGMMRKATGLGGMDFNRIGVIIIQMLVIYGISVLFSYLQGFIMAGVSVKITYRLRNDISGKIHRLPFPYFDKNTHGDILSRITNDADTISQTLNQSMTVLITSAVQVIGTIIMMLTISIPLTLVAMLILPLSMVIMAFIMKRSRKYFIAQQRGLGRLNGHIEEMFGNHIIVKAFNGEKASVDAFEKHNQGLYHAGWKANFLSGLMWPIIGFVGNIGYVSICIAGGALTANGYMTVGGIQAFIQYTRGFGPSIANLANIAAVLQHTAAAAERVFEFLGEEEEIPENTNPVSAEYTRGHINFENVAFGYHPEILVIKNFNAIVRPGQKIAIVGPTGAGKTTIVKLLMRFYDVNSGKIELDGSDIRLYTRDGLRSFFGMVLQDTWLFNGTIAENIRYGKLTASDDVMVKAARAAQAHHFIRTLPEGYQMMINEEADNISAGQKQLLTIARTILADPEILILDEATSSVDTRTEVMIQKAMDNLMKGRTSFIIAHRLSTIRSADLILVMRDGDIAEQGTHMELLAKNGFYTELYNSQFDAG